ncbi:hypothetical protein SCLCIDRAFT_1215043 [Scleroderma citrinum Foug A]|uniref:Carbohydrate-binding module family 19 domain-containing protein n=1 Tax=Scleroderma citrinum Foug A TaxID=1036808 RepID=A0A0C3DPA6_9AGAM|nr:hypothetical protein SCLCIDRAFT_1215043 [Scleroderma citrinum Foug A]
MQSLALLTLVLAATSIQGRPLTKRIAQVISDSTTQWENACDAAGGGTQCNPIAVAAFGTLLAAAGPCDQQNAADNMIDFAKTLNNNADMIKFAQIFAQQPRNSPTSQSVPYCQSAPHNPELNGLFQCQFQGDNPTTFVGGIPVGQSGTIPFGMNAPVSPAGSCPANPSGPIPDGSQLVSITQNPGVGGSSAAANGSASTGSSVGKPAAMPPQTPANVAQNPGVGGGSMAPSSVSKPAAIPSPTPASSGSFLLSNGQAAQQLNAQFASLTSSSPCTDGKNACVQGSFAQCVSGSFVLESCGATLTCAALPLVNSAGTSITCTTLSQAEARIAATGATGGFTGSG